MPLASRSMTVQDTAGNVRPYSWVSVLREDVAGSPPALLYSDRDGLVPLGNPVQTDENGFIQFFVIGGAYRIEAYETTSTFSKVLRYEAIGRAAESDFQMAVPKGAWSALTTYAASDLVYSGAKMFISRVDANLNHTPDSTTPGDTAYWMYVGPIVGVTVQNVLDELGVHKITISTLDPSGGVDNDIWFKV